MIFYKTKLQWLLFYILSQVGFFKRKEHDEMVQHKATMEKSTDENREEVEDEKNKWHTVLLWCI